MPLEYLAWNSFPLYFSRIHVTVILINIIIIIVMSLLRRNMKDKKEKEKQQQQEIHEKNTTQIYTYIHD